jgi:restriction system protein
MSKTTSILPSQSAFFHAILQHLVTRPEGDERNAIHEAVPDLLHLTEAQRSERVPSRPHLRRYRDRTGWGLSMLKAAGYVESPSRGIWRITRAGQDLLKHHPTGFDEETGRQLVKESRAQVRLPSYPDRAPPAGAEAAVPLSPDERIDVAVEEIRSAVAAELLDSILRMPPTFFEDLVLDLLHALGYGTGEEDLQRVGAAGDGGIDGIISLDRLGFEKVYVQAKRWQEPVGRPEIQAFFGALAGRRAKKGVFITTSSFTREARDFQGQVAENVVLIDGARLTSLMLDHGVGVTHYRTVRLPKIDTDYFDSE